jgi:hypothetical protein
MPAGFVTAVKEDKMLFSLIMLGVALVLAAFAVIWKMKVEKGGKKARPAKKAAGKPKPARPAGPAREAKPRSVAPEPRRAATIAEPKFEPEAGKPKPMRPAEPAREVKPRPEVPKPRPVSEVAEPEFEPEVPKPKPAPVEQVSFDDLTFDMDETVLEEKPKASVEPAAREPVREARAEEESGVGTKESFQEALEDKLDQMFGDEKK